MTPQSNNTTPSLLVSLGERGMALLAGLWIVLAWIWAGHTGNLWVGVDDILRMRHVQWLLGGVLPIEWGGEWLPGVMLYQAPFARILPLSLPNAILCSSLMAYLAAFLFARNTALMLGGHWGALVVSVGFALSPIGLRLSASAHGEPIYLAMMLAGLRFLTSAMLMNFGRALWKAVFFFALAETIRMEAWVTVLPCLIALMVHAVARGERARARQATAALLVLALIPAAWLLRAWLAHGSPFHHYAAVAKIHEGYFEGMTPLDKIMRVTRYFESSPSVPLLIAIAGIVTAIITRNRAALPGLMIALAGFAFLFATALTGTFSPLPLDRFVAVPVLMSLPIAGCFLAFLDARGTAWLKPVLVLLALGASVPQFRNFQFDQADIREKMRLNLIDAVRETTGQLAFPKRSAVNAYAMPSLPAELAINTMHVFYGKDRHEFIWAPADTSAVDLVKQAEKIRAHRLFVDPRDHRAIREFHGWYYQVHTLKQEPPVPGWEPVRFADGVFLVIRTKPHDRQLGR
ncbi:hypothetical protein IT570_03595 [Candidatus Sumerlaeota bacterium]|nr:hypothetical protein [Candidatus Sumerlaeota bacterium]